MPAGLGLVLGVVALGPGLGWGFVLRYDMVFVPEPPWSWSSWGVPRGFPSSAVVAVLGAVVPAELVQKGILLGIFVLGAAGVARLLPGAPLAARLVAGAVYVWNPYMAERLLIGQWALLLGYAGLPWAIHAAARLAPGGAGRRSGCGGTGRLASGGAVRRPHWSGMARLGAAMVPAVRLGVALIPAAVGGFAAWSITAPVVLAAAFVAGARATAPSPVANVGGARGPAIANEGGARAMIRRAARARVRWAAPVRSRWATCVRAGVAGLRAAAVGLGVLGLVALPWVVPGVMWRGGASDPAGVGLFAARADTPFGALGSLLALGGVWNREVVPSGYGQGPVVWIWLGVVLGGLVGFWYGRRKVAAWGGLVVGAAAGYGIAAAGVIEAGRDVLRWLVANWPAFGMLRDGQRFVAPLAVLVAVGFGVVAWKLVDACAQRGAAGSGRLAAGVGVLVPVMLLPTLAYGAAGRIEAVEYPRDWTRAREIMAADPVPGAILSLPWSAYRGFGWNGGRTVLDPAPSFFPRRVIWNDGLQVGDRTLAPEDPAARAIDAALRRSGPILDARGRIPSVEDDLRVRYILLVRHRGRDANKNMFQHRMPPMSRVLQGTDISLYRLVTSRRY